MKRYYSILVSFVISLIIIGETIVSAGASYENYHTNTGDGATDLVSVASTQVGYYVDLPLGDDKESNCHDKYSLWFNENINNIAAVNNAWASIFVVWCANEAGVDSEIIPYTASERVSIRWYENNGLFQFSKSNGGEYIPQKGDLVYFSSANDLVTHMGIVEYVEDDMLHTIEGNTTPQKGELIEKKGVLKKSYPLDSEKLYGFATPKYQALLYESAVNNSLCSYYIGDVNRDWKINTSDVRELLFSCITNQQSEKKAVSDINEDGMIDTSDARAILLHIINGTCPRLKSPRVVVVENQPQGNSIAFNEVINESLFTDELPDGDAQFIIQSKAELDAIYAYDQIQGLNYAEKYNDAYFSNHAIVLLKVNLTEYPKNISIEEIVVSDGVLTIFVNYTYSQGAYTAMYHSRILLEISKDSIFQANTIQLYKQESMS